MLSRSLLLLALGCGLPFSIVGQQDAAPLLVAAASDLAPVETDLSRVFRRAGGGRITFTLASSGMLARQIQQGAPYDVYLSANEGFVQELVSSGHLVAESVRIYAHGRIALWSKSGTIRSLSDLHDKKVLHVAIANPAHAPYGMAARDALQSQGVWKSLGPKLVYGENVRQAFQLAESGNADAVITAWTLVFNKGGILLPENWHAPIRQAGGIVKTGRRQHSARRFLDFLTSEEGRKLLTRFGLFPPKPSGGSDRRPPSGR